MDHHNFVSPHDNQKPYIKGRWMVTGPDYPDGSGWSFCIQHNGKCKRCVATFHKRVDAIHAAKHFHAHDKPVVKR